MIAFTLPWALVGLVAAGLPLLLHVVRRHEAPEVIFPAVRYLEDATRHQHRRLRFRHWLLLLLRTLLIVALVLAAAGATVRRASFGPHAPSALVVVIDNSAASSAVTDGVPLLANLVRAASQVLDRATLSDRVWLIAADGVARSGSAAELRRALAQLRSLPVRLDLGRAVTTGVGLVRGSGRPGQVVVVSALQSTALSAMSGDGNVLVLRPGGTPPANRGIARLDVMSQPWSPAGGRVSLGVVATDTVPVPVTLAVGGHPSRDVLSLPGTASIQRIGAQSPGWVTITASLPPDEFRFDDARTVAVRIAPVATVQWDPADRFIDAAAQVLAADGRIKSGPGIRLGTLAPGPSIVMPPEDPARVGALNRALAARGVSWRFGGAVVAPAQLDSGNFLPAREAVSRRHALEQGGATGEVLATVNGEPWLVQSGDVVLIGSRLDPGWTALPLSASFVPFLDALLTSTARGDLVMRDAVAGEPVRLPDRVTAVAHNGVIVPVGGAPWTPEDVGVFHLLAGADTLGAISAHLDPRESDLTRAQDRDVRALWRGATVADLKSGAGLAFATGRRGDLRGALLIVALLCVVGETVIVARAR